MTTERADTVAVWLTGPPGAGKTTIANLMEKELRARGVRAQVLDGDELRRQLSPDLGFSRADRDLHVRRAIYVARLLVRNGVVPIVALVSPYRATRDEARRKLRSFVEVYVSSPPEVLRARDPKGLYREADAGRLRSFTGVDDPYETPLAPELAIDTSQESAEACAARVVSHLEDMGWLRRA